MISRIRPYFDDAYINAVNNFDEGIPKEYYSNRISDKLKEYYPEAKKFEFFDMGRNSLWIALNLLNLCEGDEILIPCFTCRRYLTRLFIKNCILF